MSRVAVPSRFSQQANRSARALVVIDSGVADAAQLAAGVVSGAAVLLLDPNQDGVAQITGAIQAYPHLTSLHLVGHGQPGSIALGNRNLSLTTLEQYAGQIQSWFSSAAASLLIYGCNVGAGDAGTEFLHRLHQLTRAGVAASKTLTGNAALGGNWELEASIGAVDRTPVFQPAALRDYPGTLATISGKVWRDLNSNGAEDSGEAGLEGVTVFLDADDNGQLDSGEASTTTDATGGYSFTDLDAGTYTVAQLLQPGWQQTSPLVISDIAGFRFAGSDNGDRLQPTGDAIALGGYTPANTTDQAAVVLGNSKRTIVNGFSVDAALSDAEGLALATQQIQMLQKDISNVLIFQDLQESPTESLFRAAATNLGLSSQVFTSTSEFQTAVAAADPSNTLIIVNTENFYPDFTGLINHVSNEGKAILYFWNLDNDTALASAFQVSTVGERFSPEPIYSWSNDTVTVAAGATETVNLGTFADTAPTSADATVSTDEDIIYTFQPSNFAFTDIEKDSFTKLKITSLPGAGALFLDGDDSGTIGSGEAVTLDQEIAVADLSKLKFKPADNANGDSYASFGFQVNDGSKYSSNYVFMIDVAAVNDAPESDDQTRELAEGSTYSFDADDFVFSDVDAGNSLQKVKIVELPTKGSLTLDGETVTEDQEIDVDDLDQLSYSPVDNENGTNYAKIDFQVSDGTDYSGLHTIVFNVSGEPDAPVIAEGGSTTVTLDEDSSLDLTLTATDADDDPISWSIKTTAGKGNVSIDENGKVTYKPNLNYSGIDSFEVEASDGKGNTDSINVKLNILPVNDAPTIASPIANQSAKQGDAFSFTLPQNTFSDVDGDSLSLSASVGNGQPLPQWLSFDPATGSFSGTPARSDAGQLTVTVTAKDQGNLSVSDEFVLNISELPILNLPAPNAPENPGFGQPPAIDLNAGKPGKPINGTPKPDRFAGTDDNDSFNGRGQNDWVNGKGGNDNLNGGSGNDNLNGGSGDDLIRCGTGNDKANGGAGQDIIIGGLGRDALTGGAGVDTFVFNNNLAFNIDLIMDFQVGEDLINLAPMFAKEIYAGANAQEKFQRYVELEQTSRGTLVKVDTDGSGAGIKMTSVALLQGVEASSLTSSSFVI